jgi:hypothetical protein
MSKNKSSFKKDFSPEESSGSSTVSLLKDIKDLIEKQLSMLAHVYGVYEEELRAVEASKKRAKERRVRINEKK